MQQHTDFFHNIIITISRMPSMKFYIHVRNVDSLIMISINLLSLLQVDKKLEHRFARLEEKAKIETPRVKSDSWSLQEWEEIEATYSVSNVCKSIEWETSRCNLLID